MKSRTITAVVLAYLVPGLGHLYLGRRARAITFFCILMILFAIGLLVDGRLYSPEPGNILSLLATIGSMGLGAPWFIARMSGTHGDITSITFEYGTAFILSAGLMNLLLMLDAYDIAEEKKR